MMTGLGVFQYLYIETESGYWQLLISSSAFGSNLAPRASVKWMQISRSLAGSPTLAHPLSLQIREEEDASET
jgi:hypothetical protein